MHVNSGIRSILELPAVYRLAMRLFGSEAHTKWLIDQVLAVREGDKMVDIGCGTGDILRHLPRVDYLGCDVNKAYIEAANRRYGDRGVFLLGTVEDWARDRRTHGADLVLAKGVLHHVDDGEVRRLLHFARSILKPSGRFCFL
jgi:SAM-dependent methyltransferase